MNFNEADAQARAHTKSTFGTGKVHTTHAHNEQPPFAYCEDCAWSVGPVALREEPQRLTWHYGPGDATERVCDACGGEVWLFDDGAICRQCGRQEEPAR